MDTVPLFQQFSRRQRRFLAAKFVTREYDSGDLIVQQGDIGAGLYVLANGRAQAIWTQKDGAEKVVDTFGVGDFFGEIEVLAGGTRAASVVATEQTTCFVLLRTDFLELIDTVPLMGTQVAKIIAKRFRTTIDMIQEES